MFEKYPDIVGIKELCEMLNISKPTAYRLLLDNQIQHRRVGKKYLIPKRSIIDFCTKSA